MSSAEQRQPVAEAPLVEQLRLPEQPRGRRRGGSRVDARRPLGRARAVERTATAAVVGSRRRLGSAGAAHEPQQRRAGCTRRSRRTPAPGAGHDAGFGGGPVAARRPCPSWCRAATVAPSRPRLMLVIDVQFSTSSCSNMPDVPKHMRYALYESCLELPGRVAIDGEPRAALGLGGAHRLPQPDRDERHDVVARRRIFGQLCTKLRFGNIVAADTMNPASPTSACCAGVQVRLHALRPSRAGSRRGPARPRSRSAGSCTWCRRRRRRSRARPPCACSPSARGTARCRRRSRGCGACGTSRRRSSRRRSSSCSRPATAAGRAARRRRRSGGRRGRGRTGSRRARPPAGSPPGSRLAKTRPR